MTGASAVTADGACATDRPGATGKASPGSRDAGRVATDGMRFGDHAGRVLLLAGFLWFAVTLSDWWLTGQRSYGAALWLFGVPLVVPAVFTFLYPPIWLCGRLTGWPTRSTAGKRRRTAFWLLLACGLGGTLALLGWLPVVLDIDLTARDVCDFGLVAQGGSPGLVLPTASPPPDFCRLNPPIALLVLLPAALLPVIPAGLALALMAVADRRRQNPRPAPAGRREDRPGAAAGRHDPVLPTLLLAYLAAGFLGIAQFGLAHDGGPFILFLVFVAPLLALAAFPFLWPCLRAGLHIAHRIRRTGGGAAAPNAPPSQATLCLAGLGLGLALAFGEFLAGAAGGWIPEVEACLSTPGGLALTLPAPALAEGQCAVNPAAAFLTTLWLGLPLGTAFAWLFLQLASRNRRAVH